MSRPSNWYDMSDDERRRWEQAEAQRQDAEYDAERTRERAEADHRRFRQAAASARADAEDRLESAGRKAAGLRDELAEVTGQRNALLAACEEAMLVLEPYETGTGYPVLETLAAHLRSAIAKAKGT